eukprot:TRINITY_DN5979_c0_g2_i1.p1 TRINITY_DN5979_c0_g2~~TRINITY_DN5979_c0_g2_i1.p1  ORF type:complete len:225 (+),score=51.79 TRINITY_DN5979_c0_g2_i1:58-732(+)
MGDTVEAREEGAVKTEQSEVVLAPEKPQGTLTVNKDGEHPLKSSYTFYAMKLAGQRTTEAFEQSMKKIGTFNTVEGFWQYYSHLTQPNNLSSDDTTAQIDYYMFKDNIQPKWEDEANSKGGKWILHIKKGLASKYWEDLLLAFIGEQFPHGDEVCGVVVSVRYLEDIISVWSRNADNKDARFAIRETLTKSVLNLPQPQTGTTNYWEYKPHSTAMKFYKSAPSN